MPIQHRKHVYSIEEKKRIVDEAYSTPKNIRSTGIFWPYYYVRKVAIRNEEAFYVSY